MDGRELLSKRVEAGIALLFSPDQRREVARLLPASADLPFHPETERIHLAILTLSEGDVGKLAQFAGNARRDWRDVLYWAEYTKPGRALYEPLMSRIQERLTDDTEERSDACA